MLSVPVLISLLADPIISFGATPPGPLPGKKLPISVRVEKAVPGWSSVQMNQKTPLVSETLVISGAKRFGKIVVIPPGGIFYDASPVAQGIRPGGEGLFLGKKMFLLKTNLEIEKKRNQTIRKGQVILLGNNVIEYLFNRHGIPVIVWHTIDGVAIRPHPVTQIGKGIAWPVDSTLVRLRYDHVTPKNVHYLSASGTWFSSEDWLSGGKKLHINFNSILDLDTRFSIIPIACPIGHHIGMMLYNVKPIILPIAMTEHLLGGYLRLRPVSSKTGKGGFDLMVNGRKTGSFSSVTTVFGRARNTDGLIYLSSLSKYLSYLK